MIEKSFRLLKKTCTQRVYKFFFYSYFVSKNYSETTSKGISTETSLCSLAVHV